MKDFPTLVTERLTLRQFTFQDAPRVRQLAGDFHVADTTLNIPHPYPEGAAEEWINHHQVSWDAGVALTLAIVRQSDGELMGAISLGIRAEQERAEMGYWLGVSFWNQGYTTEAARALLRYGFNTLGLHRIYAQHFARNLASGRVMQKAGMKYEGCLRGHLLKEGQFEDVKIYGMLRSDVG